MDLVSQSAFTAIILIVAVYVVAGILDILRNMIFRTIGHVWVYLTFPGVMVHELSHALLAFIAGAKVHKIVLFNPQGNTLGYVQYSTRGGIFLSSVQNFLSGIGPLICGIPLVYVLYTYVSPMASEAGILWASLIVYLMFSIICHISLSGADIKNSLKGIPGIFLIVWGICYYTGFHF